jgi:hypothetical protein
MGFDIVVLKTAGLRRGACTSCSLHLTAGSLATAPLMASLTPTSCFAGLPEEHDQVSGGQAKAQTTMVVSTPT